MNESQHHRGPDEGGLHIEPGVGLGHRRLSIIDLSTGQQPLYNEDGVCVVFNGEIYNYQELIPELQALGHVFHTRSDTEVIVHAWEAVGRGLRAAFSRHVRLRPLGSQPRDALSGARPAWRQAALLRAAARRHLLFGSELKSLLAHGGLARDIDPLAVEEYFALGYVAEPRTIFRQARKLPPGHT
jgi:asparagine synthase (glutamine-hydrolysing)